MWSDFPKLACSLVEVTYGATEQSQFVRCTGGLTFVEPDYKVYIVVYTGIVSEISHT